MSEVYVANGEIGKVVDIHKKYLVVQFHNPSRRVIVPFAASAEGGDPSFASEDVASGQAVNIELAYCISCHKSQGSEWPFVIVMLDDSGAARQVCSREWIYTAISRAKVGCFLVGTYQSALMMARRVALDKRLTMLSAMVERQLGELVPF